MPTSHLFNQIHTLQKDLITWRRHLHAHPELSFCEKETANYVEKLLTSFGIQVSRPTPTSVLGILKSTSQNPCAADDPLFKTPIIALRADMDALPIHEENTFDFASKNPHVMHACGHDGHTAILLGAAKVLSECASEWEGEIRFLFQHGEEVNPGGASELVAAGVLEGVDLILGTHLWVPLETGQIGIVYGPAMASPDEFKILLQGKGGHAAAPHETIDPIFIGAQIVTAFQGIISRGIDPLLPAVISFGEFHAGSAHNVIPDTAHLTGTLRTFDPQLRREIPARMEKILAGICSSFGATYEFQFDYGYEPVINHDLPTALMEKVVRSVLGDFAVYPMKPVMGGEDFSAYQAVVPGCFFFTGAGNLSQGAMYPHHHPRFTFDEEALFIGVRLFVEAAYELLRKSPSI